MKETLDKLRKALVPLYGKGETEAIIRILFHYLKGWNLTDILIHGEDELSPFIKKSVDDIIVRLLDYEPIQYITGEARFHGMDIKVNPDVLIPRQETDELVDLIIDCQKDKNDLKVLDLCTGSGCIAIALAKNLKFAEVEAIDFSAKAIDVAKENVKALKASVDFEIHDIFKWTPSGEYDVIVSNPPYVDESEALQMEKNVLEFEPKEAIFVPDDNPLIFYDRIADVALDHLSSHGSLYLEVNPRHVEQLKELLKKKGLDNIEVMKDSFGKDRFIMASLENS